MTGASEKQVAFAVRLADERLAGDTDETFAQSIQRRRGVTMEEWVRTRTRKAASTLIDTMLQSRKVSTGEIDWSEPERDDPPEGVHRAPDGTVYRVQVGRNSGNLYATRVTAERQDEYVGRRPFRDLSEATLLTFEEACELSAQFGFCVRCSRRLTAKRSVSLGIGPVCGKALHDQEKVRERAAKEKEVQA